jgi:hypothetical protein
MARTRPWTETISCSSVDSGVQPGPCSENNVLGWPRRRRLAHAILQEYSSKRLELAQLLCQLGVFLTCQVPRRLRQTLPHAYRFGLPARAGNRRFWRLSALRTHTKVQYKTDLHRETLRALDRVGPDSIGRRPSKKPSGRLPGTAARKALGWPRRCELAHAFQ